VAESSPESKKKTLEKLAWVLAGFSVISDI